MGVVEAFYGDAGHAARLLGAAASAREAVGKPLSRSDQADWDEAVATACTRVGETAFEPLWAEGRAMTQEQAVTYALTLM
jgi:hypothetical protein